MLNLLFNKRHDALKLYERKNKMKKFVMMALAVAAMLSLSACMGVRGYHGSQRVCENQSFLGISIIEVLSPCK